MLACTRRVFAKTLLRYDERLVFAWAVMMRRVLVYGDSNSWGFPPVGQTYRYLKDQRWPTVMQSALSAQGLEIELLEDCLPGRTTQHDDSVFAEQLGAEAQALNGAKHLSVALRSHQPLDLLIIMLGTNDCKARFSPSTKSIANGLEALVAQVRKVGGGGGSWFAGQAPAVLLVVPPPLGEVADAPTWARHQEWSGGRAASKALHSVLAQRQKTLAIDLFDAASVVEMSALDPIHFDDTQHRLLGVAIAEKLQALWA